MSIESQINDLRLRVSRGETPSVEELRSAMLHYREQRGRFAAKQEEADEKPARKKKEVSPDVKAAAEAGLKDLGIL